MKLVFVAGPYREQLNMDNSRKVCKSLWGKGFAAIASHTNTPPDFMDVTSMEKFAEGYLEVIKRCDLVMFLPNWHTSKGCQVEMEFVIANDIPYEIISNIDEL